MSKKYKIFCCEECLNLTSEYGIQKCFISGIEIEDTTIIDPNCTLTDF